MFFDSLFFKNESNFFLKIVRQNNKNIIIILLIPKNIKDNILIETISKNNFNNTISKFIKNIITKNGIIIFNNRSIKKYFKLLYFLYLKNRFLIIQKITNRTISNITVTEYCFK